MTAAGTSDRGFTLIELMVVMALVAALSAFFIGGLGENQTAPLQTAQAALANVLAAARTRAIASGQSARVLIHVDPASPLAAQRYLRYLALQTYDGARWNTVSNASLPASTYVVPRDPTAVGGLLSESGAWTRPSDGGILRSTALRESGEVLSAIGSDVPERWASITFSSRGSTSDLPAIVIAIGHSSRVSASPVTLENPNRVRGFLLSRYGVAAFVNGRSGF